MKTCREEVIAGFVIKIEQHETKSALFRVSYGQDVIDNLTYKTAALEYGLFVFHALACDGLLDNEGE